MILCGVSLVILYLKSILPCHSKENAKSVGKKLSISVPNAEFGKTSHWRSGMNMDIHIGLGIYGAKWQPYGAETEHLWKVWPKYQALDLILSAFPVSEKWL